MKVLRGKSIYLPAYFEDSNNDPVTGATTVKFHWRSTDDVDGATDLAMTAELGGGWYNYLYTDTCYKPIIYWATLTSYKNFPGGIVELQNLVYSSSSVLKINTTTEQTLFYLNPVTSSQRWIIRGIMLDLVNLTKDTIINVKERIDGTNARNIASINWNSTMNDGVYIGELYTSNYVYITAQSLVLEGATRVIPYQYHFEILP